MGTFKQDLAFAWRVLRKAPGFTAIAVMTLALGIGANSAIFSVVDAVLLRPLPYPDPDRIVRLWESSDKNPTLAFAEPNFTDVRAASASFEGLAQYSSSLVSVSGGAEPARVMGSSVSRDFFRVLGVHPVLGRSFSPEEHAHGAAPAMLVSYAYWQQQLGSDRDLSKLKLVAENQVFSVAGVLPPGFRFPDNCDVWMPREVFGPDLSRTAHNWRVIGRLHPSTGMNQARAELGAIAQRLSRQYAPDIDMRGVTVRTLEESLTGPMRPALWLLSGAVGFLLLVACANVANLLLAQAASRQHELAIRTALGASPFRLVRQFLTETLVLAAAGGVVGLFLARWGVDALAGLVPEDLPQPGGISVNAKVLLFTLGVSFLVAVALGLLMAWRAMDSDVRNGLGESGRGQAGSLGARKIGRALAVLQVAVTMVLLTGAGLFGRSLLRILAVDPGFRTESVLTMDLALPPVGDPAAGARRIQFLGTLLARLREIRGVEAVGGANALPLGADIADGTFAMVPSGREPRGMNDLEELFHNESATGNADFLVVSEDYFRILGIPLRSGRFFAAGDTADRPHVAVISESLARSKWPGQEPLGRTIEFGNMDGDLRLVTIVGVVGDARARSVELPPRPTVYVNALQRPNATSQFTVILGARSSPAPVFAAAREVLHALDPGVPPRFATFSRIFATSLESRRFNMILVGLFAATALILAMAGIYGVIAYSVTQRTREIGVRVALGAGPREVLLLVLGQGVGTAAAGIAVGLVVSAALSRTIKSLLFGVTPSDPLTFGAVVLLLFAVALAASYVPARRATRIDPLEALRSE